MNMPCDIGLDLWLKYYHSIKFPSLYDKYEKKKLHDNVFGHFIACKICKEVEIGDMYSKSNYIERQMK